MNESFKTIENLTMEKDILSSNWKYLESFEIMRTLLACSGFGLCFLWYSSRKNQNPKVKNEIKEPPGPLCFPIVGSLKLLDCFGMKFICEL